MHREQKNTKERWENDCGDLSRKFNDLVIIDYQNLQDLPVSPSLPGPTGLARSNSELSSSSSYKTAMSHQVSTSSQQSDASKFEDRVNELMKKTLKNYTELTPEQEHALSIRTNSSSSDEDSGSQSKMLPTANPMVGGKMHFGELYDTVLQIYPHGLPIDSMGPTPGVENITDPPRKTPSVMRPINHNQEASLINGETLDELDVGEVENGETLDELDVGEIEFFLMCDSYQSLTTWSSSQSNGSDVIPSVNSRNDVRNRKFDQTLRSLEGRGFNPHCGMILHNLLDHAEGTFNQKSVSAILHSWVENGKTAMGANSYQHLLDKNGCSVLMKLVVQKHNNALALFLACGPDVRALCPCPSGIKVYYGTVLHYCVLMENSAAMKQLVTHIKRQQIYDVTNIMDSDGRTPLALAVLSYSNQNKRDLLKIISSLIPVSSPLARVQEPLGNHSKALDCFALAAISPCASVLLNMFLKDEKDVRRQIWPEDWISILMNRTYTWEEKRIMTLILENTAIPKAKKNQCVDKFNNLFMDTLHGIIEFESSEAP